MQQSPMMGFVDRQSDLIPIKILTRGLINHPMALVSGLFSNQKSAAEPTLTET